MQQLGAAGLADIVLLLCGVAFLFLNEYFCCKFICDNDSETAGVRRKLPGLLNAVLRSAIWIAGWLLQLPMALLYLLLLLGSYVSYRLWRSKTDGHALFWSTLFFTARILGHTLTLAIVSLCQNSTLGQTYHTYYILLMFCAELFLAFAGYISSLRNNQSLLVRVARDSGRFHQCTTFLFYTVIYHCFDALLVQFDLPFWQVSAFLLCSSLLISFQLVLFFVDTDNILRLAEHKDEYARLEEQRAEQIKEGLLLRDLAYRDSLTGASNRRYAEEMLASLQKDYTRITVAYIDVDGLKKVNDSQGHQAGDRYLCAVADCLNSVLCKTDVLARIGGDEFLVISTEQDETELNRSLYAAKAALCNGDRGVAGSFSFGVVETGSEKLDIDAVLRESDRRMYRQKTGNPRREVSDT